MGNADWGLLGLSLHLQCALQFGFGVFAFALYPCPALAISGNADGECAYSYSYPLAGPSVFAWHLASWQTATTTQYTILSYNNEAHAALLLIVFTLKNKVKLLL